MAGLIVAVVLVLFALFVAAKTIRIIPQARAGVVERLGRYSRTLTPGMTIVVPFIDRVRPLLDLREQVVTFPPQPVITADNVSVGIDTVLYFTITEPKSATYEVANPLQAIEQLTVTTLRNIIGSLTLEETLTSRDAVNDRLRIVLDERTGKWGIRINGVELKSIAPPATIQEAMEKQMRAERDRRAAILNAEGVKQSQILTAEGDKQAAVLRAEGERAARILQAEGQAKAISTVFDAIHSADPDPKVLAYQYMQALPQIAAGQSSKVWIVPAELTKALEGIGGALGGLATAGSVEPSQRTTPSDAGPDIAEEVARTNASLAAIEQEAAGHIEETGGKMGSGLPARAANLPAEPAPDGSPNGAAATSAPAAPQPDATTAPRLDDKDDYTREITTGPQLSV